MLHFSFYRSFFQKLLFFCLFSITSTVHAQLHPVQVNTFLRPPHLSRLNEYATSTDTKLTVQLLPIDMNMSHRRVNLKMYIEGNNLKAMTTPTVPGMPIYISAGAPVMLTNLDIANHFRLQNLLGISPQQYANLFNKS